MLPASTQYRIYTVFVRCILLDILCFRFFVFKYDLSSNRTKILHSVINKIIQNKIKNKKLSSVLSYNYQVNESFFFDREHPVVYVLTILFIKVVKHNSSYTFI